MDMYFVLIYLMRSHCLRPTSLGTLVSETFDGVRPKPKCTSETKKCCNVLFKGKYIRQKQYSIVASLDDLNAHYMATVLWPTFNMSLFCPVLLVSPSGDIGLIVFIHIIFSPVRSRITFKSYQTTHR